MQTKSQLINQATKFAEDIFDNQMLELLEKIKPLKGLHQQHRFTLITYIEANKKRLEDEQNKKEGEK